MIQGESTSWELLERARAGHAPDRDEFARVYSSSIRAFLSRRWRSGVLAAQVEDAVQDVFLEFLKPEGALEKSDPGAPGGFRALLAAVVRNVAARHEKRIHQHHDRHEADEGQVDELLEIQTSLSQALDREWAQALAREAAAEQERRARERGGAALVRVEILRLRFHDGLPIREIAERMELEADYVHHQFAKARRDYKEALLTVLRGRFPKATAEELEARCGHLMELLR